MSERTYYPLNISQKILAFSLKFVPKKELMNICSEIEFTRELDAKLMLQALTLGLMRSPSASMRMHLNENKEIVQYFSDAAPEKIDYLDYTGKTEAELNNDYAKWSRTAFPNKHMDTQLYMSKLIKKPNGNLAIYSSFSHLIADSYAIMQIHKEIVDIYVSLEKGEALPPVSQGPIAAYEADYKYLASDKSKDDVAYFDKCVFDNAPQFTTIMGKDSKAFNKNKRYGNMNKSLLMKGAVLALPFEKGLDDKVMKYATEHKVSPQSLYVLAIRTFLSKVCEVEDVTLNNSIARRATIAQKKGGGTMVNGVVVRFRFGNNVSFSDGCAQTYEGLCTNYRHANATYEDASSFEMKFKPNSLKAFTSLGISYQPYLFLNENFPFKYRHISNGRQAQSLYITILPFDSEGTLGIDYDYQVGWTSEEAIRSLHKFIQDFLNAGLAAPDKTLAELMKN